MIKFVSVHLFHPTVQISFAVPIGLSFFQHHCYSHLFFAILLFSHTAWFYGNSRITLLYMTKLGVTPILIIFIYFFSSFLGLHHAKIRSIQKRGWVRRLPAHCVAAVFVCLMCVRCSLCDPVFVTGSLSDSYTVCINGATQ